MKHRLWKPVVAALVAAATLGTGAIAAYAAGDGDEHNGKGGGGTVSIMWKYKDDASGSFGPATDPQSVVNAFNAAGIDTTHGMTSIRDTLESARVKCANGFMARHPGEGDGECRVVAVGAAIVNGKSYTDDNAWTGLTEWQHGWDTLVKPYTYYYAGQYNYQTSTPFWDDPGRSVDSIANSLMPHNNEMRGLIIIVLDKYEPAPPETPPAPPTKAIEQGVSADSMTNTTTIETGTGIGGKNIHIYDTITPNGIDYRVENLRLVDTTDNADVQGATLSWDKQNNTVNATFDGKLPKEHTWRFTFDVTVDKPSDFKQVQDTATVDWNHKPQSTQEYEFPTWQPKPDKSWIRFDKAAGKWQAVIDPEHSNTTGADTMTFLDGDKVGSVVNGTIGKNLIAAPESLTLTDDYANADYVWDTTKDVKQMRVYEADAATDRKSSVANIINTGKDVTDQWNITVKGTVVTATAKPSYLKGLKGLAQPKQVTLFIPGAINLANGKGAAQARKDYGKQPGDELTTCVNPAGGSASGSRLTNAGAEQLNNHNIATNEPNICVYVPPVKKDVISEASQAGSQDSVDGKVVFPGQKVEYRLETQPQLPSDLGYTVEQVVITDTFDQYLVADKQTVEVTDLSAAKMISKREYTTKWDDAKHQFVLTFGKDYVAKHWANGQHPRLLVRFEGTVSKDAPAKRTVDNQWVLTLNNSITPSNTVVNTPPEEHPHKSDKSIKNASVSIDGKTLLVGEQGLYQLTLDARQKDTAYKVWRLGMTDDFDQRYVKINPQDITVMSDTGKDVTSKFNIQVKDGVAYVYAKTVDTEIPATGETVKGDPQPKDLAAYASLNRKYVPLHDPVIDQALLGHTYTISLPYTVIAGGKGTVVENTALQLTNDVKQQTETVKNPVEVINPQKDVTVKVGGESVDSKAVYLDANFLYQLDSSVLPVNRAYPEVSQWGIDDQLDPTYDVLSGQWAVYAARDLYKDGQMIAAQGDKIGGSNFNSAKLGGDLFTGDLDAKTGKVVIAATDLYLKMVSADTAHEQAWRAYIQVKRVQTTERHDNQFVEHVSDKDLTSNIVWTYTPDLTPSLHIEKYDAKTGEVLGDRDDVKDALQMHGDSLEIAFKITNTSKTDSKTGKGAYFAAKSLKLDDQTIAGVGEVEDLRYPDNWDTLVLKPGESTVVTGMLKGVHDGDQHTDRVKVTGTPLVECPVSDEHPFDTSDKDQDGTQADDDRVTVKLDGKDVTLCKSTDVESNTDDWSGYKLTLAETGAQTATMIMIAAGSLLAGALGLHTVRRRARARHIA